MRPSVEPVHEFTRREPAEVVPMFERLEHRGQVARPAWVGMAQDSAPRPFYEPPRAAAAPAGEPIDPTGTPEFQQMMQDARRYAEESGRRAAQEEIDALRDRYLATIAELERCTREAARPHGHEIVSLAMVVAREIIGRELACDRGLMARSIDDALEQAGGETPMRVRVAHHDLEYLGIARRDLIDSGVIFVDDPDLNPGGCVVETAQRVVDATIETRLLAAREAVMAVLDHAVQSGHEGAANETPRVFLGDA